MPDYQKGKIYKIEGGGKTYYGSTCESKLSNRLAQHRYARDRYNRGQASIMRSFQILDEPDCRIYLVENYPCNCKDELLSREGYHIKNNDCVNKYVPKRTRKEYYQDNAGSIIQKVKKWREDNKEYVKVRNAKKYQENKEKIQAKRKEKHMCECGIEYTFTHKARHEKTKTHIQRLNSLKEETQF